MVSMWLEIDEIQTKSSVAMNEQKVWNLEDEPIRDYQVRVAVYDTENIPMEDIEGTSDVFIKSYIDHKGVQQTDTHYRCMNGEASFNYRILFDIKAPRKDATLVLQAWDRDLFTKNDYICEWTLNLKKVLELVQLSQQDIHVNKQFYTKN